MAITSRKINKMFRSFFKTVYCILPCLVLIVLMLKKDYKPIALTEDFVKVGARSFNDIQSEIVIEYSDPKEVYRHEELQKPESHSAEEDDIWDKALREKFFAEEMPNQNFVFHNKLPKSGSSTMNNILKVLSKKYKFGFLKAEAGNITTYDTDRFIDFVDEVKQDKFVLLKHHEYLDFENFNREQPTYINVMRDPISWFTSRYYFSRYGWERQQGCRENCGISEEEKSMTIDECVERRHQQCTQPWPYIMFFCGLSNTKCSNLTTMEQKKEAVEIAKFNILHKYYAVGILEQFEDTLNMFDRLMPTFYKDATETWKSNFVQYKQKRTKTLNKKEMSEESKQYFRDGPLHYEIELYNFAKKIFNERLKRLDIEPVVLDD